jgi:hypothetical protein
MVCSTDKQYCKSMILSCKLFDVMDMDLDVFGPLSLHWVSAKLEITLIVTPNDSRTMNLDAKLDKEVLKPKCLISNVDRSIEQ